ncbi:hypothetical protein [Plasticicumulans acidivorans]|uniref:Uncharacterized protein n=1 Tax=Plasticicumulans acidivorans TaxID=886464 RepID=A0A317MYI9_9GAMM|nr:hypothetical protein [Plasticicumulans acidivorans]PWV64408.1 hypothetical protein C7443_10257 [Plasticicumulans acidivorans]
MNKKTIASALLGLSLGFGFAAMAQAGEGRPEAGIGRPLDIYLSRDQAPMPHEAQVQAQATTPEHMPMRSEGPYCTLYPSLMPNSAEAGHAGLC